MTISIVKFERLLIMHNRGNLIPEKSRGNLLQLYEDVVSNKTSGYFINQLLQLSYFYSHSLLTGMLGIVSDCYTNFIAQFMLTLIFGIS